MSENHKENDKRRSTDEGNWARIDSTCEGSVNNDKVSNLNMYKRMAVLSPVVLGWIKFLSPIPFSPPPFFKIYSEINLGLFNLDKEYMDIIHLSDD